MHIHPLLAIVALPLGLALADLTSGLVHWFCDTFLNERAPLLGRTFIAPFREHHRDPSAILSHDFVARNGSNALAAIPIALIGAIPQVPSFAAVVAVVTAIAIVATNQIHAWAHMTSPPRVVRILQSLHIVLSPAAHAVHHQRADAAYCVTTGWLNPILDGSGLLRGCAALLTRLRVPRGVS